MFKVQIHICLNAGSADIYSILTNIQAYPAIFPFYIETREIDRNIWSVKARMNKGFFSEKKGELYEWKTKLQSDAQKLTIRTEELGPKFPLKRLEATWEISVSGEYTKIMFTHEFEIINFAFTKYILYPIVSFIIKKNSRKLLDKLIYYHNNYRND
ncbi:MAG: hypothetical protein LBG45_10710 [Dysgonamonadaceae bacterium]|jgi:ribosome-associated toxin RatA of RatAB toxin-antitoxin module|nr:hypothetical protein [Dysgonamonadaceae bacterium]